MDDLTVIRKCQNGEGDAFRDLVERYGRQAAGHAAALLFNREDALDAVQEAFIDAFRAINKFDKSRPFYPWFYVLLRNRCYRMRAKDRPTESVEDMEIMAPKTGLSSEESFGLETALLSLSREHREIITLKYLDGLSYDELAEYLQIPRGTVMSRLFHARRQMQATLKGSLDK